MLLVGRRIDWLAVPEELPSAFYVFLCLMAQPELFYDIVWRACKDLGFDLPCDWTVEIPCGYVDTASSGANSPASGSWRISSPGDDPKDVKARLKVWAQAVALTSASRLGS